MSRRIVFATSTVISALLFQHGRLAWLRLHWQSGVCIPLISEATASEILRVLAYPKFRLASDDRQELLGEYLPYCQVVEQVGRCPVTCRDVKDQPFLDLAWTGAAEALVTGDTDLLVLAEQASFAIETPESYRLRSE